eukprot:TRINITY_DN30471_c0_g1_i1.p1 TRINITY_DN30471_c0_g1~~TRINITY_DN30471_c0_g1_i1.p1  ORF type:complete len:143 (-),score=18.53 TRINITY_DN30471_c0_g1_i1:3-431(-)
MVPTGLSQWIQELKTCFQLQNLRMNGSDFLARMNQEAILQMLPPKKSKKLIQAKGPMANSQMLCMAAPLKFGNVGHAADVFAVLDVAQQEFGAVGREDRIEILFAFQAQDFAVNDPAVLSVAVHLAGAVCAVRGERGPCTLR